MKKHTNYSLEIYFNKRFEGIIWRILPDTNPDSNEWIIETRDQKTKSVQHTLIDLTTPEVKWSTSIPFIEWSTQLVGMGSKYIFFHQYPQPDVPQPDNLIAIDSQTLELKWELPHHHLIKTLGSNQLLTTHRSAAGLTEKLYEIGSGQPVNIAKENLSSTDAGYKAMVRYLPDNIYFSQISSFLKKLTGIKDPIAIDYLEANQFMVLSYYIYSEKAYEQWILVTDHNGSVCHLQKTGESLSGIGIETILFKNNKLVFLNNNNEFTSLNLTQ